MAGSGIVGIKIWRIDGTIAYSTWPEFIGQRFALSETLKRAFTGKFATELEGEGSGGDTTDIGSPHPMLEVYAPVRSDSSGRIVAIAEYYSIGSELSKELNSAEWSSWIVVAAIGTLMLAALSGIVFSGSRTIDAQRQTLRTQVTDLETLVKTNEELRDSIKRAHARSVEIHERLLRRVGADLHDGPAQLLSLALLLSHALEPGSEAKNKSEKLNTVNSALNESLREIRSISAGLMLPEITTADLEHVIRTAVQTHATHTGTAVSCDLALQSTVVPDGLKVCCYRFVQEALNNAFKHAGGKGQSVVATEADHVIVLEVSDQGPGLRLSGSPGDTCGMGLIGMRDRIETLGGKLDIASSTDGCRLTARFDLRDVKQLDFNS